MLLTTYRFMLPVLLLAVSFVFSAQSVWAQDLQDLTPQQQQQLQEYQEFFNGLSPEQRQQLQEYQGENSQTNGQVTYDQVRYRSTTSSRTQRLKTFESSDSERSTEGMRSQGQSPATQGQYPATQGQYPATQGQYPATQGQLQYRGQELSVSSEVERYFGNLAMEEKQPRGQVPLEKVDLQQFGFDFFRNTQGIKVDQTALVGPDYVLGPDDTLRIDIWGNIEGHYEAVIDREGNIVIPKVGVINLMGQTFARARETIENQIGKYFKQFQVNVSLDSLRSINVYLVGEVNEPGTYQVSSLSSVLSVMSVAGGPSKNGSLRNIQVLRRGQEEATLDFYDFFRSGDNSQDIRLQSGDTILVPVAGPLVAISGDVRRPAIYELSKGETLEDLLAMAGGTVSTAYLQKIRVQRVSDHNSKVVIDLSLAGSEEDVAKALSFKLRDRDLIEIAPITDTAGYVTLTGYVARPGEYQLEEEMRLADLLLPYDNLLPDYFPQAAQIVRKEPPQYREEIITVDLQRALEGDLRNNLLLQEYDRVQIFSREEMEELPEVMVSGAILRPGVYRLFDNMTIADLVTVAGNLKRSAYLDLAELTRYVPSGDKTIVERYEVDLKEAMQEHPQHNLALQPDDHLIVRSIPDFGERMMVNVKGEVLFPGRYAIGKGETISSVLKRAGGFTDKAYLRGAVFSRESLKEKQRQQIEKLIAEEQKQLSRLAEEIAIGAMSAEEAKSAETLLANRRTLLEDLKNTPATGRLVISLAEFEEFKDSPQDIMLMNDDELVIPENPQTVNIQGEVYNSASLSWQPDKTVGYYLNKVGGLKETANDDEIFIVRADGTVVSKQQAGFALSWDQDNWRWNFGGFENTIMYPGDTILVPEQYKRYDWMREAKDISTIIYQMALGAAAVASF